QSRRPFSLRNLVQTSISFFDWAFNLRFRINRHPIPGNRNFNSGRTRTRKKDFGRWNLSSRPIAPGTWPSRFIVSSGWNLMEQESPREFKSSRLRRMNLVIFHFDA
ncbi:mCG67939, isoform CRA_e, partial [Mus musculus]